MKAPQKGIKPVLAGKQGFVRPFFNDAAIFHADDAVAMAHGRQPVRDDDDGSPADDFLHVGQNDALAFVVERTCGLVQDQDRWIGCERAGYRNPCR